MTIWIFSGFLENSRHSGFCWVSPFFSPRFSQKLRDFLPSGYPGDFLFPGSEFFREMGYPDKKPALISTLRVKYFSDFSRNIFPNFKLWRHQFLKNIISDYLLPIGYWQSKICRANLHIFEYTLFEVNESLNANIFRPSQIWVQS